MSDMAKRWSWQAVEVVWLLAETILGMVFDLICF